MNAIPFSKRYRLSARTSVARVAAVDPGRSEKLERVFSGVDGAPFEILRPGVVLESARQFRRASELLLNMSSYCPAELEEALSCGFKELRRFASDQTPVSSLTLRRVCKRPGLTSVSVSLAAIGRGDRGQFAAWQEIEEKSLSEVFLWKCFFLPEDSISLLARTVRAGLLVLEQPIALHGRHVTSLLERCTTVHIIGRNGLRGEAEERELVANAGPGRLRFAGRSR